MTDKPAFKKGFDGVMRLYLQGEIRRCRCGWRLFHVHVGTRNVVLTDQATGRRGRITREVFDRIVERRL